MEKRVKMMIVMIIKSLETNNSDLALLFPFQFACHDGPYDVKSNVHDVYKYNIMYIMYTLVV